MSEKDPKSLQKAQEQTATTLKKKNKKTNSPYADNAFEIVLSALLFTFFVLTMTVYLARFTATGEQDMINNSYNSRQQLLLSRNYRGTIYSADGEVLAETVLGADQKEERIYPFKELFSHVVGFSGQGKMGVEAIANYYLINTNISMDSRIRNDIAERKNPGDQVYTTLQLKLQQAADRQLSLYNGAVVVTEVKTGKILAMVSHPDFDPNKISEIWDSLVEDQKSSVLLNRATQGLYPPGSTFKIFTALEYYREYPDSWQKYSFTCNGSFRNGSNIIHCNHSTHHGQVDFLKSFAKSCNSSFANMGSQLNRLDFSLTLQNLLFDSELPLELAYKKSSYSLPEGAENGLEMMQTSIGQGKTQITPMHLNLITCAIANDGILMKPYCIDKVISQEGNPVKQFQPEEYGRLLSIEEAHLLQTLMKAVVEQGTASSVLKGSSYTSAGKTGSAEFATGVEESHAWYTGFAPAEDPEICVTVIVEGAGTGGDYAVPIAKSIFDEYFSMKATNQN